MITIKLLGVTTGAAAILFTLLTAACSSSSGTNSGISSTQDPNGTTRAPASGCTMVNDGCVCAPGASTIECGRNQIPTDPDDFRHDVYFVTPCCAATSWPSSGTCTCENRVGVKCSQTKSSDGKDQCQCGAPFGGFQASGTVEPSGGTASCSKPSGGKCCAIAGPNGSTPYVGCICAEGSSCKDIMGGVDQTIEVDHCEGASVFSPYCPAGLPTETGTCGSPPGTGSSSSSSSSSGSHGGCGGNSDCGDCERCELSTGNCVSKLSC